jgi:hypothetical protein
MRTGFDVFTAVGEGGYIAEKAESQTGWLFPVGDEVGGLGYRDMFTDMLNALDHKAQPRETFYDGYVVNAIMDAAYKSVQTKRWEPVEIADWRGQSESSDKVELTDYDADHILIKEEKMPDGRTKVILKNKVTGNISQKTITTE